MPLLDQIEILAGQLPQRVPDLVIQDIFSLPDQFFEECDQRLHSDRTLALAEHLDGSSLHECRLVTEKFNHQGQGLIIFSTPQPFQLLLQGLLLLLHPIRNRGIRSRRQSVLLDLAKPFGQFHDLIVDLTALVGREGQNIRKVHPLAEITLAIDLVIPLGDEFDDPIES